MAAAAKKTNWFAIWTSIMVAVIVIGVGAAVIIGNNMANPDYNLVASEIDESTGAVTVGDGPQEVATYIDFMCPACNSFESAYSKQLLTLASEGKITLSYRPVAILDGQSTTQYSTRAANAFYCVAKESPAALVDFVELLYKNQPSEGGAGLDDAKLAQLATEAGAGDISACQSELTYASVVANTTTNVLPANPTSGSTSTPTVEINGEYTELSTIFASRSYFTDLFATP